MPRIQATSEGLNNYSHAGHPYFAGPRRATGEGARMGTQLMEALAGLERRDAQRLARVKRLAGLALALAKTAGTLRVTEQSVLSALYNPDAASALEQLAEIVADLAPQPEVA